MSTHCCRRRRRRRRRRRLSLSLSLSRTHTQTRTQASKERSSVHRDGTSLPGALMPNGKRAQVGEREATTRDCTTIRTKMRGGHSHILVRSKQRFFPLGEGPAASKTEMKPKTNRQ